MRLKERLVRKIRSQGKAESTAEVYWYWTERFLRYAKQRRGVWVTPEEMGERQVEAFLSSLANSRDVSANTQNQAFSSLCYLYRHVLGRPLEGVSALRAKAPQGVRDVVDQSELLRLFEQLEGVALLSARMMYASSFRIGEIGNIRIKDISFERQQIVIRGGKGKKDRVVKLPKILHAAVDQQIESMHVLWKHDSADGLNGVSLPHAWGRKSPSARMDFGWWYLLTSDNYSRCPRSAAQRAGIHKRITSHCLRHSFATHSLENGVPIHVVQKLMGHTDIRMTEGYLHASTSGATSARSPLEDLLANPPASSRHEEKQSLRVFGA